MKMRDMIFLLWGGSCDGERGGRQRRQDGSLNRGEGAKVDPCKKVQRSIILQASRGSARTGRLEAGSNSPVIIAN